MDKICLVVALVGIVLDAPVEGRALSAKKSQPLLVSPSELRWSMPCSGSSPNEGEQPTLKTATTCRFDGKIAELKTKTQHLINRVNIYKYDYVAVSERLDNKEVQRLLSFRHVEIPDIPIMENPSELLSAISITYKLLSYCIVLAGRAMEYERKLEEESLENNFEELMTEMSEILCRLQLILRCNGKEHDVDRILSSETLQAIRSISSGYPDINTRHELDYLLLRTIGEQADHLRHWLNDIQITITVGKGTTPDISHLSLRKKHFVYFHVTLLWSVQLDVKIYY